WLDIYICSSGSPGKTGKRNRLYINNQNLTFTESAARYGLDISGYCTQAAFFDYDLDGDLDCFLINNSPIPFSSLNYANMRDVDISKWEVAENLKGGGNHLYRNDEGHFTEVTKEAGLHSGLISFGLGVSVGDVNGDNYLDIYVGNDFIEKDYLYINQKDGTFKDDLEDCIQKISMSSMSSDLGDINNDGQPEIFTTDMIPEDDYRLKTTGTFDNIDLYMSKQKAGLYHQYVRNCLQVNNGNGTFSEVANFSGVSATDWSWGALFFDADNDGLNDIFVCNGVNRDVTNLDFMDFFANDVIQKMVLSGYKESVDSVLQHIPVNPLPNYVFKNKGNLQFSDAGKEWGFTQPSFSSGAAYGDLDNDGDLDVVINNINQPSFVYRNNARERNGNSYISIALRGRGGNRFAVGSKIKVYKGGEVFYREVVPSRGFQSSVDYRQVIGLGKSTEVDSMIVVWPDRTYSRYERPALNQLHVLEQPGSAPLYYGEGVTDAALKEVLLEEVPSSFDKHQEDDYIDFYYERNLPELLSREGPHLAKGDVNGDGLEDVYVGGAKGQAGQLYVQSTSGSFVKKEQPVFTQYADFEDVAVLFFDADRDGDLDLFVGAGGNNVPPNSRELQHRLYKNDGRGNFTIDTKAFPSNDMNIAVAAANDYDGDGDLDLFVGSRSVPREYGSSPRSYLYQNDGRGYFKDVTTALLPSLAKGGMITGAVWADVNSDKRKELVVTGEWMTTRVFTYSNGRFKELENTGLDNLYGWWQTLAARDVNGDGSEDLIIGNIGENFYLRPDRENPVKLWVSDFDHNGTMDQFLTRTVEGRDVPVFLKREITEQFPALKKDNLKHSDYATKSIQQLFPKELLREAVVKQFNYCSSIIALSNGKGGFTVKPLPLQVQLSSVNAVESMDVNGDGREDLIIGGNLFGFPPQFGRLDATYGSVLLFDGRGGFTAVKQKLTGLNLKGEIKDIKQLKGNGQNYLVITQNNQKPVVLKKKK
ncbi:MAG TPA: VCBS repeat-containing protein, partial [Flavisolibacter sp.]|nr:VCBS repeat-containing protein [Flavisolibacter sp.]